ncbi:formate dehydrogenase subunit alpha [Methanolobus mangrovi]|uniref:Formate dehydrogenase subunit alpha n=1 Tax=Methanolobus mangrovi TaxID=3072977 RepID=A0AA51UIV8_9EURY|nr:formate dehydrogenase subunit alpha [Methanolobus mangrovi]WMW22942.1 formate dehydrogenase subunit alpha [Methanolobus mangrovi]
MNKIAYINDQPYAIQKGESILQFVKRSHSDKLIPTLCDTPHLKPFGACRVCSVDVALEQDGPAKVMASCHTPVSEGIYIYPSSERILKLRKNIIELVLTNHPLDCLTCEVNNNCELQEVAARVGVRDVRYPVGKDNLNRTRDLSHPYMTSDLSKCINCSRCVRACDEVQGMFVLSMAGRGFESRVIKGMDTSFIESSCVSCGACAQACPTSAISDVYESKSIIADEKIRTICTYCGVGCNLEVAVKDEKVRFIQAPWDSKVNSGHLCLKGRFAFSFYNHPDRIRTPFIKKNGVFVEANWDEAYDFIASELNRIIKKNDPDHIAGISSARCPNEENYLMQKFMRAVIGTNNIDNCARVCHSPTALGMQRTFGTGAATNSIDDIKHTDCILVFGANPTDAHPVTGAKIKQAAMKDTTLIVIDPRKTELARYAHYHLQLKPGTNVALMNLFFYYIIKEDLIDTSFIEQRTEGFEEFKQHILSQNIDELESITGVDRNLVHEAAIAYASAKNAMSFHGLGATENSQGTSTVMLIANLAMITGNIGLPGVSVNPLRGQNNVQGAADMGCQPNQGAGYLDVTNDEIHALYEDFYGAKLPKHIGYNIPQMYEAALQDKLKAMWIIGENVVQTDSNSQMVIRALSKLELLVVQELFMTETARLATVILPAASFLEKEGTFTNGERRVQRVNRVVNPLSGTRPDGQIITEIMQRMGYPQPDYSAQNVLNEIAQIVPFFKGITWQNLGKNGLQWPVADGGGDTPTLHEENFKRGKGAFYKQTYKETSELQEHSKDYPFIITTNRGLEHYNSGAMTRRTPNEQIVTEDVLLIHPDDAKEYSINNGDMVCVESPRGKTDIKARISTAVKKGILSTTFHFSEVMINNLTSDVCDSDTQCPEYKVVAARIR